MIKVIKCEGVLVRGALLRVLAGGAVCTNRSTNPSTDPTCRPKKTFALTSLSHVVPPTSGLGKLHRCNHFCCEQRGEQRRVHPLGYIWSGLCRLPVLRDAVASARVPTRQPTVHWRRTNYLYDKYFIHYCVRAMQVGRTPQTIV